MAQRWSRRERLIFTARRMGLRFRPDITDDQLRNLIDRQPATDEQVAFVAAFLKPLKRSVPPGLTYGQAIRAISAVKENQNQYAINAMRLEEGHVRFWRTRYYLIVKIYGDALQYRMLLQRVALSRPRGATHAVQKAIGAPFYANPIELLDLSMPIDLATWHP